MTPPKELDSVVAVELLDGAGTVVTLGPAAFDGTVFNAHVPLEAAQAAAARRIRFLDEAGGVVADVPVTGAGGFAR